MNEIQRSVLQRHYKQLSDDIMMTEDLLAALFTRKVFERGMIETIKAEKTPTDQVYKMLSMLPKRGPDAFDIFVDIVKDEYPWLAAMLETSLRTESQMQLSRQNSLLNLGCTSATETQLDGCTLRQPLEVNADSDVKTKVGTFIHKQFGQSKRISQQDKKVMEKWLLEQIQSERKSRAKKSSISTEEETQDRSACTSPDPIQGDLQKVYNKVRDENLSDLLNSVHANKHFEGDNETKDSDEIDASFKNNTPMDLSTVVSKLDGEIDKLINRMNHMEGLLTQCHYILGDPDRKQKLPTLIKDSQVASKQFEKDLNKEKAKTEKMLHELYDYCKSINRLENVRQQQRLTIEKNTEEIEKIRAENAVLREKCTMLETVNNKHMEKEKTLNNLKKMVDDLKSSHTNLADENANYRINYGTGALRNNRRVGVRNVTRRGSTVADTMVTTNRKPATKQVFTSSRRTKPLSRFQ
ncbi:keratin, type II cytoskeletal 75-like [Mercenaria mercenaria]|uniref:keratin, type II cytoskeletal 75-like n=1 Tax=Mercenaria mercenaria TaxID=6596 RepID=UPI00234EC1B7|nr:keratin, type II cytoskeletal 75-like [Mercenaria mercenaria]